MTTTIDCERQTLEFDAVPEYLRDTQLPTRDVAVNIASNLFNQRSINEHLSGILPTESVDSEAPKSEELEVLWPGVHHENHDFSPTAKRSSSFFLCVGFAAGAVISLVSVFGFFTVSNWVTASNNRADNKVVIAGGHTTAGGAGSQIAEQGSSEVLSPAAAVYQVQPGDTLAGIAYKNYKRISPRLLDEIAKANNMRNANVLNLGQKLKLPEYRPSSQTVATTASGAVQ